MPKGSKSQPHPDSLVIHAVAVSHSCLGKTVEGMYPGVKQTATGKPAPVSRSLPMRVKHILPQLDRGRYPPFRTPTGTGLSVGVVGKLLKNPMTDSLFEQGLPRHRAGQAFIQKGFSSNSQGRARNHQPGTPPGSILTSLAAWDNRQDRTGMDWGLFHHMLKGLAVLGAFLFLSATLIAVWRVRGIFGWNRSLRRELRRLEQQAEGTTESRKGAVTVVVERCREVWRSHLPELSELADLPDYVRAIARSYHPEGERPELKITTGRLLRAARESVRRLDLILQRRGFQTLRRVRIRHLRQSYAWYDRLSQYRVVRWLSRYQKVIRKIFRLRLYILPDPFSWLFYLSRRLTILTFTRYLLLDIYLFVGVLAVEAYGQEQGHAELPSEPRELERSLEDLNDLKDPNASLSDPQIQGIRSRLVGGPGSLLFSPGIEEWKGAIKDAAELIARRYFPDSDRPLEEAALGPLLERCRFWITSICETEKLPVVHRLHRIRLETLDNVRVLAGPAGGNQVASAVAKIWSWYRMSKWPQLIVRWLREGSPGGLAMKLGWLMVKGTLVNFLCRYTFDRACKELDMVYRESWGNGAGLLRAEGPGGNRTL